MKGKVIDFKSGKISIKNKKSRRVLQIEVFDLGDDEYSFKVIKDNRFSEGMATYCTAKALREMVDYTFIPEDILIAVDDVLARIEDVLGMDDEMATEFDDEGD